jgi:putative FmdB family regulatory protein
MPLFEYRCKKCEAVTEALVLKGGAGAVTCAHCGSRATVRIISRVSFKVAKRAKYSDDFLDKARPFLKAQKQTAAYFAEGKGSDDAKTFRLAETIGQKIDRTLARVRSKQQA